MLLADTQKAQADVRLCRVSEELDGVRAFWDGQRLRTRSGHSIAAPDWFVASFPRQALDGELWIGRGEFERLSAVVRRQTAGELAWREVRHQVFERLQASSIFRQGARALCDLVSGAGVPWLLAVEQFAIGSREALEQELDEVVLSGSEGLMLHRADAAYVTGRSDVLLKLKRWLDAEATVIGHQWGRGKYAGMLGALRAPTADGVAFMLGSGLSDASRPDPPPVGTQITFRYRELTDPGWPRSASFQRPPDLENERRSRSGGVRPLRRVDSPYRASPWWQPKRRCWS